MSFPSKNINWGAARKAFVERVPRPTYDDIALEFGCSAGSLARFSSEDGWPAMRAQYMERQLATAEASQALLEVVSGDRAVQTRITSFVLVTLERLTACVESIEDDKAPATKANVMNTCTFALANITASLKNMGMNGLGKALDKAGKDAGKEGWTPGMMQQINLTVQTLTQQAAAGAAGKGDSPPPGAAPVVSGPVTPTLAPAGAESGAGSALDVQASAAKSAQAVEPT